MSVVHGYKGKYVPQHYHSYVKHPSPLFAGFFCCTVCGMAVPKSLLDAAIKAGATVVKAVVS